MATELTLTDRALGISRRFTTPDVHPYDEIAWGPRDAKISEPAKDGTPERVVFQQDACEFPLDWSDTAVRIVASKYFRYGMDDPRRETSLRQVIDRVVDTIRYHGVKGGYFADDDEAETFAQELRHILVTQKAAFNSPVWFNCGVDVAAREADEDRILDVDDPPIGRDEPQVNQASACFILSVNDTMPSIQRWIASESEIFRGGSGAGVNLSNLRGDGAPLSNGGQASGPVSFMRWADSGAGSIKSGGGTRRAAKMVILDGDHPDVLEFVRCKAHEEAKAYALGEMGYDLGLNGDAWRSIQFQNANNSVRLTDDFFRRVEEDREWQTFTVKGHEPTSEMPARDLLKEISEAAWACGDPGVQYEDTIQRWHTSPNAGRISGSNPCFPADARVHTTKGPMAIGRLVARTEAGERIDIYTHRATAGANGSHGEPGPGVVASTPVAVMRNGVSPIVRLRFADGGEIRCTPNHRIWTDNRGYVRADELTGADLVRLNDSATPASAASWELPVQVAEPAVSFARGGTKVHTELPRRWSAGLAELMGHLVGDGCVTDEATTWVYGGDDIADGMDTRHRDLLTELVGGASRQEMDNGTVQLRVGSRAVRALLRGLGVSGERALSKRLPAAIVSAPTEVQAAFLSGLFGADGCVARVEAGGKATRYVGLGSASRALLVDVQRVLNTFGIRARLYATRDAEGASFSHTRADGTNVEYASSEMFDLRITGTDMERFAASIGFSAPRKQAALEALLAGTRRYATRSTTRLVAREDDGQEEVYNLTEPLHHSYIVDGVLVANCSEYMHVDDSACNLASINLMKFLNDDGTFRVEDFRHAVRVVLTAQEIVVTPASYPTKRIGENARAFRQLGLGYTSLGSLLMCQGLAYDSDEGRAWAGAITALMQGEAYAQSARMAARVGAYDGYAADKEAQDRVVRMHRDAVLDLPSDSDRPGYSEVRAAASQALDDAVALGQSGSRIGAPGYRNAQVSVIAPTGTISFMMDAQTTGIEPAIGLVSYKTLVGGGYMKLVNTDVERALTSLGYTDTARNAILAHIDATGSIEGAPGLLDAHLPVFDCAFGVPGGRTIGPEGHVRMMAAVQPFISGAISKTVNLPNSATVEDVADIYTLGWRLGLKAIAIYRDGSKRVQPLSTSEKKEEAAAEAAAATPIRRRLPDDRAALTHKFSVGGQEGYITVGLYEDGSPGEIFVKMSKQGSTVSGLMDSVAIAWSMALQHGVPVESLISKYIDHRFEPSGFTGNPRIPMARSVVDYLARWMASKFLSEEDQRLAGVLPMAEQASAGDAAEEQETTPENQLSFGQVASPAAAGATGTQAPALGSVKRSTDSRLVLGSTGQTCTSCGSSDLVRAGSCLTCRTCGATSGCG
jgi:ribonucleoside-diphosphate reductase alpha chain